jgi:hypothetical protein
MTTFTILEISIMIIIIVIKNNKKVLVFAIYFQLLNLQVGRWYRCQRALMAGARCTCRYVRSSYGLGILFTLHYLVLSLILLGQKSDS